jgi:hypothetical protein
MNRAARILCLAGGAGALLVVILGFWPELNPIHFFLTFRNLRTLVELKTAAEVIEQEHDRSGTYPTSRDAAIRVLARVNPKVSANVADVPFRCGVWNGKFILVWSAGNHLAPRSKAVFCGGTSFTDVDYLAYALLLPQNPGSD